MHVHDDNEFFEKIDRGIKKAVNNALLHHKKAGQPIHIWKNNKIVKILPEDIKADENPSE